jgi:hypothetical protein
MKPIDGRRPVGRFSCALLLFLLLPLAGRARPQDPAAPAAPPAPSAATAKPKKVWTNDDIEPAARASAPEPKPAAVPAGKAADSTAKLAAELRSKLEKLAGQLKETEKQLNDLKNFASGEGNGNDSMQLHKGYNMEPIPEQIEKLQAKQRQIAEQIDALYDEARKKGILPGQLR